MPSSCAGGMASSLELFIEAMPIQLLESLRSVKVTEETLSVALARQNLLLVTKPRAVIEYLSVSLTVNISPVFNPSIVVALLAALLATLTLKPSPALLATILLLLPLVIDCPTDEAIIPAV